MRPILKYESMLPFYLKRNACQVLVCVACSVALIACNGCENQAANPTNGKVVKSSQTPKNQAANPTNGKAVKSSKTPKNQAANPTNGKVVKSSQTPKNQAANPTNGKVVKSSQIPKNQAANPTNGKVVKSSQTPKNQAANPTNGKVVKSSQTPKNQIEVLMDGFLRKHERDFKIFHKKIAKMVDTPTIPTKDIYKFDDLYIQLMGDELGISQQDIALCLQNDPILLGRIRYFASEIRRDYHDFLRKLCYSSTMDKVEPYLKDGLSVNMIVDGEGNTLLHAAIERHPSFEIMKHLLEYSGGVNVNARNMKGETLLHRLASLVDLVDSKKVRLPIIQKILSHEKVDINLQDERGDTILHRLMVYSKFNHTILEFILQNKELEINKQNNDGNTPLHLAAQVGDYYCAKLLLKAGANDSLAIKNNIGKTPRELYQPFKSMFSASSNVL